MNERQYTWSHCRDDVVSLARLDRLYCFKHNFNIFKMCKIYPVGFTDHSLVMCNVLIRNIVPRSAYWHFNSTLLYEKSFRDVFYILLGKISPKIKIIFFPETVVGLWQSGN